VNNKCKTCNVDIKSSRKYCSLKCYHESLKLPYNRFNRIKNCLCCNKEFVSTQHSQLLIDSNIYCSKKCRRSHQSIRQKTGTNKTCAFCNKEFYAKKCHSDYKCCSIQCANKFRKGKYNPNMSLSRSKLIAEGKCNPKRNFYKQGWHHSTVTGNDEWFGSSYEEKRMKQLDSLNIKWTKKHGIRIPYIDPIGNRRNYVPDFLVNSNIIEEVKPSNLVKSKVDNNNLKYDAAIEYCKLNNYQYRIITEKDLK
jgi:hypothetical protein